MESVRDDPVVIRHGSNELVKHSEAEWDRAEGFERMYARHYRPVYRYVLGLTRSVHETEDIVAETFERALRASIRGTSAPARGLPWLLVTARHVTTDRWRRARRFATLRLSPAAKDSGSAGRETEFWLWFDALAEVLPERQREVLLLRYQRDLSDADIASIMGLSSSGVRSLVARALETLRAHPELLS